MRPSETAKRKRNRVAKRARYNGVAHPPPMREIDEDYLAFIRKQPCMVNGTVGGEDLLRVDPCHTVAVKAGGSDYDALPMIRLLHEEQHRGRLTFATKYGIDYKKRIAHYNALYERETGKEIKRGV